MKRQVVVLGFALLCACGGGGSDVAPGGDDGGTATGAGDGGVGAAGGGSGAGGGSVVGTGGTAAPIGGGAGVDAAVDPSGDAATGAGGTSVGGMGGVTPPKLDAAVPVPFDPTIRVLTDPSSFDFGDAISGSSGVRKFFEVRNTGNVKLGPVLPVFDFSPQMAFVLSTTTCDGGIAIGSSCVFSITFTPPAGSSLCGAIVKLVHEGQALSTLPLKGKGIELGKISATPQRPDFGAVAAGSSKNLDITLTNSSIVSTNVVLRFAGDVADFSGSSTCLQNLGPGSNCSISLQFKPTQVGLRSASLTLDGGPAGSTTLALSGSGSGGWLEADPAFHDFGKVVRGQADGWKFSITGRGLSGASLSGAIKIEAPLGFAISEDTCSGKKLSNGQTCTALVSLTNGGALGSIIGQMTVSGSAMRSSILTLKAFAENSSLSSSVVGEWAFDRNLSDSTGNGNHGTSVKGITLDAPANSPVFSSSTRGYSITMADQRWVRVAASSSLMRIALNRAAAATMWMRAGDQSGDTYAFALSAEAEVLPIFAMGIRSSNKLWSVTVGATTVLSKMPADQSWHHAAASFDGSVLTLYVDGKRVSERDAVIPEKAVVKALTFGARASGTSEDVFGFFSGDLAGLRLYDRNLTPEEVVTDMSR
jgi:hypothetical protein